MKYLLVLCFCVAAVSALPAKKDSYDDSDESFFLYPMNRQHKKEVPSVVEVEVGDSDEDSSFFPSFYRPLFINPFSFMNFGFSDFFSRPSWFDSLIPKEIPDAAVKNSTSSTKIVDGHKITVNQTTYENEKNGAVYKFQVIEVSPVESNEKDDKGTEEKGTEGPIEKSPEELDTRTIETTEGGVKPDQNSQDNEIHREEMLASYELQGDDPSVLNQNADMINIDGGVEKRQNIVDLSSYSRVNKLSEENAETINTGRGRVGKRQNAVDLSSDIRVNKLLAENARRGGLFMVPPEVEVFDTLDYDQVLGNLQNQEIIEPQYNQQIIQPNFNQQRI